MRNILFFVILVNIFPANSQSLSDSSKRIWFFEPSFHLGHIVKNSGDVSESKFPHSLELSIGVQTHGSKDWHHLYNFPKVGCSVYLWDLGNRKELGRMIGVVPNLTINTQAKKWFSPKISAGLGVAFFEKQYNYDTNPANYYIGSTITAIAFASAYITPKIANHWYLKTGITVGHCSNGHYQVPNLGINLPSVSLGIGYSVKPIPNNIPRKNITVPPGKIRFTARFGVGIHELADTKGPVLTPKYAIYVVDLCLAKRYGKISNVLTGLEIKHYNSFYNYIVRNDYFSNYQKLKATVLSLSLGHELMIKKVSLLTQGSINVYNPFFNKYIERNGPARDFKDVTKKLFSTRLGIQYYLFDPRYCTRSNVFIGTYIKANFGQADFLCTQIGFVF